MWPYPTMPSVLPRTSWLPVAIFFHAPWCTSRTRSPSWRDSITISESTSSATLRVFENGALKTHTPRFIAGVSAIWFVPMQYAPTAISCLPASSTRSVTRVLLRMPSS